jgi:hypothetical protein
MKQQPALAIANKDGQLRGTGSGNQIHHAQQFEKLFFGKPFTATDDFLLHERNVRRRSAEGCEAKAKIQRRQCCQMILRFLHIPDFKCSS